MRISGLGFNYSTPRAAEEEHIARTTDEASIQLRLAEKSKSRKVLLALAANVHLSEEVVQVLYGRDLSYLSKRLDALGYERASFLGRLFK